MGTCAIVCLSERTTDLCDLEGATATNERLGRHSTKNVSQPLGRLQAQDDVPASPPRKASLSSISAVYVSRVDDPPRLQLDDKKDVLRKLPPKPACRKKCQGLRVILPQKVEKRQPTAQSSDDYTRAINRSLQTIAI